MARSVRSEYSIGFLYMPRFYFSLHSQRGKFSRATQEKQPMACSSLVSTIAMGVPQRGRALRIMCPENSCCCGVLLWLLLSHHLQSKKCLKTLKELPASLALTIIVLNLSQALFLKQISYLLTSFGKNLEM